MSSTLIDLELELDVLTSLVRDPRRAAFHFVTLRADVFAYGPHRRLYEALRSMDRPCARIIIDAGKVAITVEGLAAALEDVARVDGERAARVLLDVLDRGVTLPLLPFGDRMVERLNELARRRRWHRQARDRARELTAAGASIIDTERMHSLLASYVAADLGTDVTDLELELERITQGAAW